MSTAAPAIDARAHRLRLIRPDPDGEYEFLGRTFAAMPLPVSAHPTSPDLVEGTYTNRDGDAGEFTVTFPNAANSDGYLWRDLFDPNRSEQFLEIRRGLDLEFVGVVERVDVDRGRVEVSGRDASVLLKRAYERDRSWTASPFDVIGAYTRLPVLVWGDDFDGSSLDPGWSLSFSGPGGGTTTSVTGGAFRMEQSVGGETVTLSHNAAALGGFEDWDARVVVRRVPKVGDTWTVALRVGVGASYYQVKVDGGTHTVELRSLVSGTTIALAPLRREVLAPFTLELEARGRWLRAFVAGDLVGTLPNPLSVTELDVELFASSTDNTIEVEQVVWIAQRAALQADVVPGAPPGDPASPGALPWGGLRGRYFNDQDMRGLPTAERHARRLSPERTPAVERIDPVLDTTAGLTIPAAGVAASNEFYSVRWTGAIYLNATPGGTTNLKISGAGGVRLWLATYTHLSVPLIDEWGGIPGSVSANILHDLIGGRPGWYPIVVEFHIDTGAPGLRLLYTPTSSYTDPGGTAITSGVERAVPATSLSPLGIYDNRVQGQSHFDLVFGVAREFGYELRLVPRSLESGEFPGRLVPVHRLGRDTDVLLVEEEDARGTPLLTPGRTLDGSEQAVRVRGNAQGLNGTRGNVTAEVIDVAAARDALFVQERWVDAGDVAFPELLAGRLNAELALSSPPWEEVRGNALAQDRLADTWPLSGELKAMRWEPGDGVRLRVRDVGIDDTEPRRITQVTRTFAAEGRTGASVGFRNRPRGPVVELRRMIRQAVMPNRSAQGQLVVIPGQYVLSNVPAGSMTDYSRVAMVESDYRDLVRAYVRVTTNTAGATLGLEVNGVDRTAALGGPWTSQSFEIDVTAYARPAAPTAGYVFFRFGVTGAASIVEFQAFAEVMRR